MKYIVLLLFIASFAQSKDMRAHQYSGVEIEYEDFSGKIKKLIIEREIDPKCMDIPISNDLMWEQRYASNKVPDACKATFVTSVGQIQAIKIHPEIETYGEMELMQFIKDMQSDDSMMLIDSRTEEWYDYRTIPGAINLPYVHITKPGFFADEYEESLEMLGIRHKKGSYNFDKAKTIALFCNGSWCSQSTIMINKLLELGYPPLKIKWYRGGMHDWLMLSMTSTRNRP